LADPPKQTTSQETLADLGESELIRRLGAFAPPDQFADDAALLPATGDSPLVVNTDVLVEGIHFSDATTAAADVGWRATAANLSDLAAMGCTAVVGITVALVAPAATPWPWVAEVYGGIKAALQAYGGVLLGGDCSGGSQRLLAITALGTWAAAAPGAATTASQPGEIVRSGPIRRGDGLPGDLLVSTGPHGLSRLGLALLQGTIPAGELDPSLVERAIQAHRRPQPRFDAVRALIASRPAPLNWRVGGCDSSDGLAAAAFEESHVLLTAAFARARPGIFGTSVLSVSLNVETVGRFPTLPAAVDAARFVLESLIGTREKKRLFMKVMMMRLAF
jgi:thiamine-monophosphate kinase